MQNINALYFLSPIIMIAFSVGLIAYWKIKKRFTVWTLLLSLVAFAGAIALKVVVQHFTIHPFTEAVAGNPVALGIYVGLQTVIFEVGGAYLAARIAFSHGKIRADDAEGYGVGLAFWENGVLVGGSTLLNFIVYYVILAGGGLAAQQLFDTLSTAAPILFDSATIALPNIGLAVLERISSLLVHFSWGLLCVFAVVFKKKRFLLAALPMGLVDFLVPYAGVLGSLNFEILFFGLCLLCLLVTLGLTKTERKNAASVSLLTSEGSMRLKSLVQTNFKRALSFGSIYLILGIVISFLTGGLITGLASEMASADVPLIVSQTFPLMLPIYAVIGSFGGLMVFVSDRTKGVYEYLIAYGVNVYEIFWSTLLVTLGLVTVVLGVSLTGNIAILLLMGGTIQPAMIEMLLIYTIPISYASVAFMTMSGMMWSSLTRRIPGVNSPIGIATLLGIGPVLVILMLSSFFVGSGFLLLVGGVTLVLVALVAVMMVVTNKRMNRERLLSDA
ncbi:MAG: YhfC family intramembrane metalloprotease [Candidatus Bathyarchaeota archaeon]|nr:YhfC family intramembrane metalloprotease [Candidatus Termiticorpusculum sp.]